MTATTATPLKPRKQPVQARSAASVDAVLEATLQVLVQVGKERLTTTRVAARAGVSVGTLYQYFPNKSSLLQATLRRHFADVRQAIAAVCQEQHGTTLETMGERLATEFLRAKLKDGRDSAALYAVSADVEGMAIAREMRLGAQHAITTLLASANDGPLARPEEAAGVLLGTMGGLSREMLESPDPVQAFGVLCPALVQMVQGYLRAAPRQQR